LKQLLVTTTGKGAPLVAIHGWGMNSAVWKTVRPALEAEFRVSWLDLPGHGINNHIRADSLQDIVKRVLKVIPREAHLLGWSLGGLIAQCVALKIPERLKSLTLVASTPRFSQADDWQHGISPELLENFAKGLQDNPAATLKRFIALQFMGIKNARAIQQALIQDIVSNQKYIKKGGDGYANYLHALKLGLQVLSTTDLRQSNPDVPQHYLFAEKDKLVPAEVINDLKLLRPDAQITLLKNAGHAPFMTHPEEFVSHLLAFIQSNA